MLGTRLRHRLVVQRFASGALDRNRQPVQTWTDLVAVRGQVEPKSVREVALLTDAGAVVSDHTVYLLHLPPEHGRLTEADRIVHEAALCAMPSPHDLPDSTYAIRGVRSYAVGSSGDHLEVDVVRQEGLPA